jgi:putative ABC transport system permease protein
MRELLTQIWFNLAAHKLRSFLTMFGILWGVISLVILSAVSEGFQRGNQKVLLELGKNIAIVFSGRTSMQAGGARAGHLVRLDIADVYAIKEQSKLLQDISPELMRGGIKVKSAFNASSVGMSGVWPVYQSIRTIEVERGRLLNEKDSEEARRVVILGHEVSKQLYAERDPVGSEVTLNGVPYTVVGKIRKKSQESNYMGPDNNRIFVPYEAMRRDFPLSGPLDTSDTINTIITTPHDEVTNELVRILETEGKIDFERGGPFENEIRTILAPRHAFDPRDLEALPIWNTGLETALFSKIVTGMREFFSAVSIITLILGGIGVMNIMLISVRERTREIGIRKSIGATARNIQWQFFSEGLVLTLVSGAVGLMGAFVLSSLVNMLPMPDRFVGMVITWKTAFFSTAALVVIGVAASTYPARRAAELPPIEALRYEM